MKAYKMGYRDKINKLACPKFPKTQTPSTGKPKLKYKETRNKEQIFSKLGKSKDPTL